MSYCANTALPFARADVADMSIAPDRHAPMCAILPHLPAGQIVR
jgi:hypothetical protein